MSNKKPVTNQHHRRPRSKGGDDSPENVIVVNYDKHKAWHLLFGTLHPEMIVTLINEIWLDPAYKVVLKERKQHER